MRFQNFIIGGALFCLSTQIPGIPALKFPDLKEYCGVTTIYVTVAPTSSTETVSQLPTTPPAANYGGVFSPIYATSVDSEVSVSYSASSIGADSTLTTLLTTTVHETVFLTNTVTGSWRTWTQTIEATSSTSSSVLLDSSVQASADEESTHSAGILTSSISSVAAAQSTATAFGTSVSSSLTVKTYSECSGGLVICPESSASGAPSSTIAQGVAVTHLSSSTAATSEVYIIETLTVIPLEATSSTSTSIVTSTGPTTQSTFAYAIPIVIMYSTASTPVTTSVISTIALPATSLSFPSQGYASKVSGDRNTSIASSSITSDIPSIGTGSPNTLTIDALSSELSSTTTVTSESINFSNSYVFYNVTSTMVAAAGFTTYSTSSPSPISPASTGLPSSSRSQSSFLTSSSLSQATDLAWTEPCLETVSSTSIVDALQSTSIPFNASAIITTPSSTSFSAAIPTSQAIWTQSCSEDTSATSTANAGQYSPIPVIGGLSINSSSTVSSSSRNPWNSTTKSSSASSNVHVISSGITASATSTNQSASYGFTTSAISTYSPTSSQLLLTTTSAMATTSSLNTSLVSTSFSFAFSSSTSEASPFNTTYFSPSSTLSFQTSETVQDTSSSPSFAHYTQLPSATTWTLTTHILPTSTIAIFSAEDTCTDSTALPSFYATSSSMSLTLNSSILTFTTLTSSAAPSASSSSTLVGSPTVSSTTSMSSPSSSSPQPSVCGEQGAFTLNFDDIPPLAVKDNSTADPLPLFSPYHQFYFSDGWTIVPPPTDPYLPSSGQLLVEFLADPDSSLGYTGAVGSGENVLFGCFNFNAIGMSLGCDSKGPNCDWQFTGLRYNNVTKATDTITSQLMSTTACAALANCTLVPIVLDSTFQNLTELHINVTVSGVEKIWWLDDLNLSWFDDSCAAGLCRGGHI